MKIWVIGRNYPEKDNNMSGSFEYEQACLLAKMGNDVSYLACIFHPFRKVKKWGFCHWQDHALHVYTYSQPYFPGRFHINLDRFKKTTWAAFLKRIEKENGTPDIIHIHYPTIITVPEAVLAYKKQGVGIVATEHWSAVQEERINGHDLKQLKTYVESADHFLCVGKTLKEKIEKLTKTEKKIIVVPNMVPEHFKCTETPHDGFQFIAVGRLVRIKQVDKIIRAFAEIYLGDQSVRLTIIGAGKEYGKLKKLVGKLKISNQITLTGMLPREQTAEIIARSDVLLNYSKLETFGAPIVESWYSGIPVIASETVGVSEYWNSNLGILVQPDDIESLEKALRNIKTNYSKFSKEYIHDYAEQRFSEAAVYEKLMKIYSSE